MKTLFNILRTFSQFILTCIILFILLFFIEDPKIYLPLVFIGMGLIVFIWNYNDLKSLFTFKKD